MPPQPDRRQLGMCPRRSTLLTKKHWSRRGSRGEVEECDWPALLRRWARGATLAGRRSGQFIAPEGPKSVVDSLLKTSRRWVISGSFAATSLAPVTAPSLLLVYVEDFADARSAARLLPTDQGADVLLVEPSDPRRVRSIVAKREVPGGRSCSKSRPTVSAVRGACRPRGSANPSGCKRRSRSGEPATSARSPRLIHQRPSPRDHCSVGRA